jgi:hypothetical protein
MRQIGLAAYEKRLAVASRTLLEHQGFDGGWGLTLSSVSSVVNTSEVLFVLRAAGIAGAPVRDALGFLSGAVREHCRPRQKGGRGEHTRFVCYGLTGLMYFPQFSILPEVAETAAWCVDWLERHQVEQGWPEVAGVDDMSLHQTALAVRSLASLRRTLTDLGPELDLANGITTSALLKRVEPLIRHGLAGLLYHRRSSGAWGWRTYVDTAPSPSKTALALMAIAAAGGHYSAAGWSMAEPEMRVEAGGVHGKSQVVSLGEVVADAAGWLMRNHHRWETFVEDDKDVPGTAWEHLAYALGVQAVLRAGASPFDPRLEQAWTLMLGLWDADGGLWNEPGASGKRATIRAAFHTAAAYEEARQRVGQAELAEPAPGKSKLAAIPVAVTLTAIADRQISIRAGDHPVVCPLPQQLIRLVRVLADAGSRGIPAAEIAGALFVAPSSVAKYVQRLNHAVAKAAGTRARLVAACKTDGRSGYVLAAVASGTGSARSDSTG